MHDYMQYFCSAVAEPASQEREHKLDNKSYSQNCPDSCDDTDHKQIFFGSTDSQFLIAPWREKAEGAKHVGKKKCISAQKDILSIKVKWKNKHKNQYENT